MFIFTSRVTIEKPCFYDQMFTSYVIMGYFSCSAVVIKFNKRISLKINHYFVYIRGTKFWMVNSVVLTTYSDFVTMDLFLVLSLCCLALGETVKAENYLGTISKDNGIFSTYYIHKEHHYLDLASLASFLLKDPLHCAFRCSKIEKCHSLNLSAYPNEYGYYICDLLSSSTLVYPEQLKPNVHYHHYEIKVRKKIVLIKSYSFL